MEKPKKRSRKILIALVIFFVICLLGAAALFLFTTPLIAPTPPAALQTTMLVIDTSKLSSYQFVVPSNTNLTLSSTDGKSHSCKILENNTTINIPEGQASAAFTLPAGEFKLNCGIPNINAKIISQ